MMKRTILTAAALSAALAAPALATPVSATLTAVDGEGTYDDTIGCPSGDGPSWKYGYTGAVSAGPLAGAWSGIFEVHDGSRLGGFTPPTTSRISIDLTSGGTASFTLADGDCAGGPLALQRGEGNDVDVTGKLPLTADFGTGAARGLSGGGTATLDLAMTAGADNAATVTIEGDFDVRDPQLEIVSASSRWNRLTDFLNRRLTISVVVRNKSGSPLPGNAFAARLVSAYTVPATSFVGPIGLGTIPAGESRTATFQVTNAKNNTSYTLVTSADAKDGLGAAVPPVPGSATFKSPLLFP